MVGKKHSTANFSFGFPSAPTIPARPVVLPFLSPQPCSPVPGGPHRSGLLPVNTLGAPWKPHTEWRESREAVHSPLIPLPHFLQAPCLASLGPGARVYFFGCPGHPGMGWAQIPGLSPSWSLFLSRVTLSDGLWQD